LADLWRWVEDEIFPIRDRLDGRADSNWKYVFNLS